MIPTDRLLGLLAAGLIPALAGAGDLSMIALALGYNIILLSLVMVDRFGVLPAPSHVRVERDIPAELPLDRPASVALRLENHSGRSLTFRYRDLPPPSFRYDGHLGERSLPPRSRVLATYQVCPLQRGDHEWRRLTLRYRSQLGLVWRQVGWQLEGRARVHPDPRPRSREEELAMRTSRRGPSGMRLALARGEGREFESLREYRPDDEYRRIDWKATARRGKFIVRQFEAERDQRVMILVDCGRSMQVGVGELNRMDLLAEGALRLARVAVEAGDRVGLVLFSGEVRAALAPGKGTFQLRRIADALTRIRADDEDPDYERAFSRLRSLVNRRCLVVLLTEVAAGPAVRSLQRTVRSVTPKHLPLVLTLKDPEIRRLAEKEPVHRKDPWTMAVARHMGEERRKLQRLLRAGGALAMEVEAQDLSLAMVSRYLDVKAKGLL